MFDSAYQQAVVWELVLQLAQGLYNVADELPASDAGLVAALYQSASTVPAEIGAALVERRLPKVEPLMGLAAQLEIVDRVYPAIDTTEAQSGFEEILTYLESPERFSQTKPILVSPSETAVEPDDEDTESAESESGDIDIPIETE